MNYNRRKQEKKEFEEEVIQIDRIARTVAGGRRIRFRAAVVIGNKKGRVGIGVAKASEVILAVQKAISYAKKHLITVPIVNDTIPHEVDVKIKAAHVILKPASPGTGIIAGGAVRAIANLSGIKNILSKMLGSQNKINNLKATMHALESLKIPARIHTKKIIKDKKTIKKKKEKVEKILKEENPSARFAIGKDREKKENK